MKKIVAVLATVAMAVMFTTEVSHAGPFSGAIWNTDNALTRAAAIDPGLPGLDPVAYFGTAANATFQVDSIDFDTRRTIAPIAPTYDNFLKGAPEGNPNGLAWLFTAPGFDINTFLTSGGWAGATGGTGTFFQFTGMAFFPENTVITHDDGFWLQFGGLVPFDYSTPVEPTLTNLGNAAGVYAFTLNYGAFNSFPEVLIAPVGAPVPEPTTMLLLGSGILCLVALNRRRKA